MTRIQLTRDNEVVVLRNFLLGIFLWFVWVGLILIISDYYQRGKDFSILIQISYLLFNSVILSFYIPYLFFGKKMKTYYKHIEYIVRKDYKKKGLIK